MKTKPVSITRAKPRISRAVLSRRGRVLVKPSSPDCSSENCSRQKLKPKPSAFLSFTPARTRGVVLVANMANPMQNICANFEQVGQVRAFLRPLPSSLNRVFALVVRLLTKIRDRSTNPRVAAFHVDDDTDDPVRIREFTRRRLGFRATLLSNL